MVELKFKPIQLAWPNSFHEYFHGDNGAGIGASHQNWVDSLVAKLIQQYGEYGGQDKLDGLTDGDFQGVVNDAISMHLLAFGWW